MKIPFALLALIPLALLPKASASVLYGVTSSNQLVTFDTSAPSTFLSTTSISGLVASDGVTADPFAGIVNLAYNYNDGQLYGLDSNSNFYRIGTNGSTTLLSSSFSPNGFDAGLGFDPWEFRLRKRFGRAVQPRLDRHDHRWNQFRVWRRRRERGHHAFDLRFDLRSRFRHRLVR